MRIQAIAGADSRAFLRLLCHLRWWAVGGQAVTILFVTGVMRLVLPVAPLWAGAATLALFNVFATWRSGLTKEPSATEVFLHLVADILVLTWMILWSGGIENPFASLFLLPIALSTFALPSRWVWAVSVVSALAYVVVALQGQSLPHWHGASGDAFNLHKIGMAVNFAVSAGVILIFLGRAASAWRLREHELATLREKFARNEGIVALATHAASVAHELNTPLATMTLLADELAEQLPGGGQHQEISLMRSLIGQCRDRVKALAYPASDPLHDQAVQLEDVIGRWQLVRPTVELVRAGRLEDCGRVDAAIGHLLLALLNNAADASEQAGGSTVELRLERNNGTLIGQVRDYGVGFDEAVPQLPGVLFRTNKPGGLGIGLALSHATVERLGGELSMEGTTEGRGVRVTFRLPVAS
jgi:two-component system sensor histidine kinase RegB